MTPSPAAQRHRRDYWIMSLIALFSVAIVSVCAELIARTRFYESPTGLAACLTATDPAKGVQGKPNSECHEKMLETPDIDFRLDSRGYRSNDELKPKVAGHYRIVLIGSSYSMGERAQFEDTISARLAPRLTQALGRPVEVYNEGMAFGFAANTERHIQDAIDVQPDLILWVVTPLDLARSEQTLARNPPAASRDTGIASMKDQILGRIRAHGGNLVIGAALRHYLYEMQSAGQYERAALNGEAPDDELGFLNVVQGSAWRQHWLDFAGHVRRILARAQAAAVPVAVTYAPNRVQAAMLSAGEWPSGFDPYAIDEGIRRLVQADGGAFIDILPAFSKAPDSQEYFFALDGHPTPQGYHFIADALLGPLTCGTFAGLSRPSGTR